MARQQGFNFTLVIFYGLPPDIARGQFGGSIQQTASPKAVLIGKFGMVLIGVENRENLLQRRGRLLQARIIKAQPFRMAHFEILVHQIGFGRKIIIEALLGNARFFNDRIDAGAADAVIVKQHGGGVKQLFARAFRRSWKWCLNGVHYSNPHSR